MSREPMSKIGALFGDPTIARQLRLRQLETLLVAAKRKRGRPKKKKEAKKANGRPRKASPRPSQQKIFDDMIALFNAERIPRDEWIPLGKKLLRSLIRDFQSSGALESDTDDCKITDGRFIDWQQSHRRTFDKLLRDEDERHRAAAEKLAQLLASMPEK
jgi:hypothetical protein